jgi:hypothetical protein
MNTKESQTESVQKPIFIMITSVENGYMVEPARNTGGITNVNYAMGGVHVFESMESLQASLPELIHNHPKKESDWRDNIRQAMNP